MIKTFKILLPFVFLNALNVISQEGIDDFLNEGNGYKKEIKALVIGVSDYQNIRSLNYAHRDAEEFASFLINNPFWNVDSNDIQLFTNESAKQGDLMMGLQWLFETATEGQEVVFYFSGHGDVEAVGDKKQGFLLAHDAPKHNYPLGGTIPVSMLDSAFTELIANGSKLTIIIDACKSGQLAGGMTGISQTNEVLLSKWENQVRILSSQPDQLSMEDVKWGNGRGVFSYFLIRGMVGYANSDQNELIRLSELENYLGENLSEQTLGAQQPIIEGPNKWTHNVSIQDADLMASMKDDVIESELTNIVASTKSVDDEIAELCLEEYEDARKQIATLNRDNFENVSNQFKEVISCDPGFAKLRYDYMRSLINEINEVVQMTMSGEKLVTKVDFDYALELIEELFEINKGKKLLGRLHFENLRVFLKGLSYASSDETLWTEHEFYLVADSINASLEEIKSIASAVGDREGLIQFVVNRPTNIRLEKIENKSVLKWRGSVMDLKYFLVDLEEYVIGDAIIKLVIYDDTMVWANKDQDNLNFEGALTRREQKGYYEQLLLNQLESAILKEPNAAYLKYPAAYFSNTLGDKEKAEKLLLQAVEQSPKWLNTYYFLANLYEDQGQFEKSLEYFEKVLDLDSIYQDFECIDCFFMGLANLCLKLKRTEKLDRVFNEWAIHSGETNHFMLYDKLLYYSYQDENKNAQKYWLEELWSASSYSFEDQMELLTSELFVNGNKSMVKDAREIAEKLLELRTDGGLEEFFEENSDRSVYLDSDLSQKLFPTNNRIEFSLDKSESNGWWYGYEFDYELSRIYSAIVSNKGFTYGDWCFYFFLEARLRYKDMEHYHTWLETFKMFDEVFDIRTKWREYIFDYELEEDEAYYYLFVDNGVNDELYNDYFEDSYLMNEIISLLNGNEPINEVFEKMVSEIDSYEDKRHYEEVKKLMDYFSN